jgi:heme exporter protein B
MISAEARPISWGSAALALLRKDMRAEMRTKVAFSAIGVFTFSSLLLLALATATLKEATALSQSRFYDGFERLQAGAPGVSIQSVLDAALYPAWNNQSKMALLWVLLCFAAFTGLAHSFVHEEETGTTLALRLSMPAPAVYAGKLLFNGLMIGAVALVVTPAYMIIAGMDAGSPIAFAGTMISGCIGLAGAATIIAALAAKARGTGALYGALGLPLLVVFLALLMNAASAVYSPRLDAVQGLRDVGSLLSYGVALIGVSSVTFHFVWEE